MIVTESSDRHPGRAEQASNLHQANSSWSSIRGLYLHYLLLLASQPLPFAAARIGTESRSSLARTARASSLAAHSCKRPGVSLELLA